MLPLDDKMKKILNDISEANTPTSSNTDSEHDQPCSLCGKRPAICGGLGLVRRELPVDHPDFGKMFRCPNNPADGDSNWQRRLRELSNLSAFANNTFASFNYEISDYSESEQSSLENALNKAMQFAHDPKGWLLFKGAYGCGKTHLAAAIGNMRLEQGDNVLFITVPDLLDHLRSSYGPSSEVGYDTTFERIRNAPVLILDDLGVENPSPWAQEKLFQLVNHRYSHQLPTVITTNAEIDKLDARIRSRLFDKQLVQTVRIEAPDYRPGSSAHTQKLQSDLSHYTEMTFDNFDTQSNAYPAEHQNLKRVADAVYSYARGPEDWLLLMGDYGTGKTHLAAAVALYQQRERGQEVMFISAPDLLDYLRKAYDPNTTTSFDQRFQSVRNVPVLVLDDLGTENATSWAKEKLFQILDYRYVARMPTVITTSKELEQIEARIRSRLLDKRHCSLFAIKARSYAVRLKDR